MVLSVKEKAVGSSQVSVMELNESVLLNLFSTILTWHLNFTTDRERIPYILGII